MNRRSFILWATALLLCCPSESSAQGKLFRKAMAEGRSYRGFYRIENNKKKMLKLSSLKKYCEKESYLIGQYYAESVVRFGDVDEAVKMFEFLPKMQFYRYVFEKINNGTPYSRLKAQGDMFLCEPTGSSMFTKYGDVKWSGQVRNGMIDGTGEGIAELWNCYVSFSGTFHEGFPEGHVVFKTFPGKFEKSIDAILAKVQVKESYTGNVSDGMAWVKVNDKYCFANSDGTTAIATLFDSAEDFSGGKARVGIGGVELLIDKQGRFAGMPEGGQVKLDDLIQQYKKRSDMTDILESVMQDYAKKTNSFKDLAKIEETVPKFASMIAPLKKSAYKRDCQSIRSYYNRAVQAAKAGRSDTVGMESLSDFKESYLGEKVYDPDGFKQQIAGLEEYYFVALMLLTNEVVLKLNKTNSSDVIRELSDIPQERLGEECEFLNLSLRVCRECRSSDFASYFSQAKPKLAEVQKTYLSAYMQRSVKDDYHSLQEMQNARQANSEPARSSYNTDNSYDEYYDDYDDYDYEDLLDLYLGF